VTPEIVAIWAAYAAFVWLVAWGVSRASRGLAGWQRRALVSLILAIFLAPSVVGGGHGGGIGPAWMALFQMFPMKLGVVPILVTFAGFFLISFALARLGAKKETNK
jgi:hypothetical protein